MQYAMFILYVADQQRSRDLYRRVLGREPALDVPGMTEFKLTETASLGLMPEDGIVQILGESLPHPRDGRGVPRAELYIPTDDPAASLAALIAAGGREVSPAAPRAWGDLAAYGADPDGHVIAFARELGQ
jgi:catechol 2,3-dioxygenase-like lactoylglutathione lyase family enzyme